MPKPADDIKKAINIRPRDRPFTLLPDSSEIWINLDDALWITISPIGKVSA